MALARSEKASGPMLFNNIENPTWFVEIEYIALKLAFIMFWVCLRGISERDNEGRRWTSKGFESFNRILKNSFLYLSALFGSRNGSMKKSWYQLGVVIA